MTGLQPETAAAIRRSHLAARLGLTRSRITSLIARGYICLDGEGLIQEAELERALREHPEAFDQRSPGCPIRSSRRSPAHKERSEVAQWNHVQLDMANAGFSWPMEGWRAMAPILFEVAMSHGIELPANPNRDEPV